MRRRMGHLGQGTGNWEGTAAGDNPFWNMFAGGGLQAGTGSLVIPTPSAQSPNAQVINPFPFPSPEPIQTGEPLSYFSNSNPSAATAPYVPSAPAGAGFSLPQHAILIGALGLGLFVLAKKKNML